jgi:hypothetical protein
MQGYQYLVLSDTNNVIDYLFASSKYKLIRGSSMILDKLNRTTTLSLATNYNGKVLSSGGGETRVLFHHEEEASAFIMAIREEYLRETDEVTLSIVMVKRNEGERMSQWLLRGEKDLRQFELQSGKKQMLNIPLSPIMMRCESCYKKPAEKLAETPEGKLKYCQSCYKKHELVDAVKRDLSKALMDQETAVTMNGLLEIHEKLLNSKEGNTKSTWIQNIAGLLSDDSYSSYIGFVYADGKNIGKLFRETLFEKLADAEDESFISAYKKISQGLHNAMIDAAVETAQEFEVKNVNVDYAAVGGDDFVAIMSGKYAVQYTTTLLQKFEEHTKTYLGEKQQIAAGVVIAKSSYPIHRLFDLSYELMTRTKSQNTNSSLDYMILTDSAIQSVERSRSNQLVKHRYLRAEGYSISDETEKGISIHSLLEAIADLKKKGFPRSKIKELYHLLLEEDEQMLQFRWIEWRSRLSKNVKEVLDKWNKNFYVTPFPFSIDNESGQKAASFTPLLDLFDLYDFVNVEEAE